MNILDTNLKLLRLLYIIGSNVYGGDTEALEFLVCINLSSPAHYLLDIQYILNICPKNSKFLCSKLPFILY